MKLQVVDNRARYHGQDPGGVCAAIPRGPTMLARIGVMQALTRHFL
jgi:hypothetical protein